MKLNFLKCLLFIATVSHSYSFEIITHELSVADGWQEIELEQSYTEPIVVTGGLTNNGPDVIAEIGSITTDSFEVRIRDWGLEQTHTADETVTIMVMERGETTYGGLTILADKQTYDEPLDFSTGDSDITSVEIIPLSKSILKQQNSNDLWNFVVMGQPIYNDGITLPIQVRNHNLYSYTDQFRFRFEKGVMDPAGVTLNECHYIVLQTGETDDTVPTKFQVYNTPTAYDHLSKELIIDSTMVDPTLMINMPFIRGSDNAVIRYDNLATGSVFFQVDEAPSQTGFHSLEEVSVVLIGENPNFIAPDDFEAIAIRRNLTIGNNAVALSSNSVAIGENASAQEENSLAVGENATTNTGTTLAVDGNTILSGDLSAGSTTLDDLTVNGSTILNGDTTLTGDVTLEQPQGDISMGEYSQ